MASIRAASSPGNCALREGYRLDAAAVTCPLRIVWGTADRILGLTTA